jgi:hypothetical protein
MTTTRTMGAAALAVGLLLAGGHARATVIVTTSYPQAPTPDSVVVPTGGFTDVVVMHAPADFVGAAGDRFLFTLDLVALPESGVGPNDFIQQERFAFEIPTSGALSVTLGIGATVANLNALNRPDGSTITFRLVNPEITPITTSTPEPSTLAGALIGLGTLGLVGWRKRKRHPHTDSAMSHSG